MKKLFKILKNVFSRYETINEIKLSTNITCVHTLDKWNDVIKITIK